MITAWVAFTFYYAIGFFVCLHVEDEEGNPPKLWHVPLLALIWPAFFVLG